MHQKKAEVTIEQGNDCVWTDKYRYCHSFLLLVHWQYIYRTQEWDTSKGSASLVLRLPHLSFAFLSSLVFNLIGAIGFHCHRLYFLLGLNVKLRLLPLAWNWFPLLSWRLYFLSRILGFLHGWMGCKLCPLFCLRTICSFVLSLLTQFNPIFCGVSFSSKVHGRIPS